jgi:hypothetical protein
MDANELRICRQRGHSPTMSDGWSQCKWCGLWRRERRTIEERESEPRSDEIASPEPQKSQTEEGTTVSAAELAICRRRGHSMIVGKRWSNCRFCGFWLREDRTFEEREDEPPNDEISIVTQNDRALDQMLSRFKR